MEIDFTNSVDDIITHLFKDLERATVDRKHPFRFCYLATMEVDQFPAQRTVVLRRVLPTQELLIFTDYRSNKIQEIKQQNQVSLLFYHPRLQQQIRFQATATIHHQDSLCLTEWNKLGDHGKNDYHTTLAPGTDLSGYEENPLHNPAFGSDFFSIISLKPKNMDLLQLGRGGHKRMVGEIADGEWTGRRVMP